VQTDQERGIGYTWTDNGAGRGYTQTDQERGITLGLTMERNEATCRLTRKGE
jgi:hypothetical protein